MDAVRTVRLYGVLGAKFGREHRLAVRSPAEAIKALTVLLPGFEEFMLLAREKFNLGFSVFAGKRNLRKDELTHPSGQDDIRIAPVILGSKQGGWLQIVLGAVLIVVGLAISGFSFGTLTPVGTIFVTMGVSMIVGGVIQLLSPQPKRPGGSAENDEDGTSYSFSGSVNTSAQGHPVPVLLGGPARVGSAVVSAGIDAKDQVQIPVSRPRDDTGANSEGMIHGGGGSSPWHMEWIDNISNGA